MDSLKERILFGFKSQLKNLVNDLIADEKLLKGVFSPKKVYHYTSTGGLLGILNTQCFHATNSSFLNDSSELQYGIDVFIEDLNIRLNEKSFDETVIKKLIAKLSSVKGLNYYVICFSSHRDDFNQWVKYAENGKGFCLEVEDDWLQDFFSTYSHTLPVVYKRKIQLRIVKQLMDEFFLCETQNLSEQNQYSDLFYDAFSEAFSIFCLFFKSEYFESEKEYRVIIDKTDFWNQNNKLEFKVNDDKLLIPYIQGKYFSINAENVIIQDSVLDGMKEIKIKSIIIGPKQDDRNLISTRMLLDKYKYLNTVLSKSKLPFK